MKESSYKPEREAPSLTCAELANLVIAQKGWDPGSGSARNLRSHANRWCTLAGTTADAPSCYRLFGKDFEALLSKATKAIESEDGEDGKPRSAKNLRSVALQLRDAYAEILKSHQPKGSFKEALNQALSLRGITVDALSKMVTRETKESWHRRSILEWAEGRYVPQARSKPIIDVIERLLELPPGALAIFGRQPKVVVPLLNVREVPYRVHQGQLTRLSYALPKIPDQMDSLFRQYIDWKGQPVLLIKGTRQAVEPKFRWSSDESVSFFEESVRRYLGFLCLPAPTVPMHKLKDEERWMLGKGMKPEDLRLSHLLNINLLWEYFDFMRHRQVNKAYTRTAYDLTRMLTTIVATERSFLRNNYDLVKGEFGWQGSENEWSDFCDKLAAQFKKALSELKKAGAFTKQRDPEHAMKDLWTQEEPLQTFLTMIERMEKDLPPDTRPNRLASAMRDICIFRMQMEVPLRQKNLDSLTLDRHLVYDSQAGLWRVSVPKAELKNKHSPHAEDIDRYYSEETSKWMTDYVQKHRQHLLSDGKSKKFILSATNTGKGNPLGDPQPSRGIVERVLKKYLGTPSGMNFFRHLAATAILKEDSSQVDAAAAVLNNSPDMVRQNYGHLQQKDGLRHAGSFYARQLAKHKGGSKGKGAADHA